MTKQNSKSGGKLNVNNRSLFIRDNVDVLDCMNSESVDLIYLDPPFNSNRYYSAPIGSKAAGSSFKDAWTLDDIDLAWIGQINESHPALSRIIDAVGMAGGKGDKSYLIYMARRLLELQRILKSSGTIYLHCDPTMSHSLKLVMDAVFGKTHYKNEIIWSYPDSPSTTKRHFPRKHDVIFRYTKTNDFVFNDAAVSIPYSAASLTRTNYAANKSSVLGGTAIKLKETGKIPTTVWQDITQTYRHRAEYVGYPTQKPLALLERIVAASSNRGEVIFDPFCGCATAMMAAEKLGRQWIGIDISGKAVDLIKQRLESDKNLFESAKKVIVRTDLPARTDNGKLMVNPKEYKHILYGKQEGFCAGCKTHFRFDNLTVDRIHPRSKGGQEIKENLQLLCGSCNSIKGDREMLYLLAELKSRGIVKR